MNSMGNPAHSAGPFKNQKREFSLTVGKVPIVPGKTFSNPNFVIKHHPSVHSHKNSFVPTQIEKINRSDSSNCKQLNTNSALINSSQSLVDTLKEHHLDTIKSPEPNRQVETSNTQPSRMCNKKNSRGNRRTRRRKALGKNSNQNDTKNYMRDMMDMEIDTDTHFSYTDISVSPKTPDNTFCLTDFIVDKPRKIHKAATGVENDHESDDEEILATIISLSPSSVDKTCMRERQVSMSESEDSFIVFNDGTDEEVESSDESDSETEEEWDDEEGEDEVDFAFSVIPVKKVSFCWYFTTTQLNVLFFLNKSNFIANI